MLSHGCESQSLCLENTKTLFILVTMNKCRSHKFIKFSKSGVIQTPITVSLFTSLQIGEPWSNNLCENCTCENANQIKCIAASCPSVCPQVKKNKNNIGYCIEATDSHKFVCQQSLGLQDPANARKMLQ